MDSLFDRIACGEFATAPEFPYPKGPKSSEDWNEYRKVRVQYREEEARLLGVFKEACLEDVGLADHPNAEKIFRYAWDNSHSSGLLDVYQELYDLANLILVDK